jgi:dipeptidyl aminopeptidase/acylaminoacyl peptidase
MRSRFTGRYAGPMASNEPTPSLPAWERRFRAPIISLPSWAADDPERMILGSTESGSYQLYAWDRRAGVRRQVTFDPVGILDGRPTADGSGVVWFHDATGAETGAWVVAPFDERAGPEPLLEGVPEGWAEGLAIGRQRTVAGISGPAGFSIWIADGGAPARLLHEHAQPVRLAGPSLSGTGETGALSADETLVALSVSEDGDVLHPSLRVIDATSGAVVGELRDEGKQLGACGFSPIPGDARLAITHERTGEERPAVWDPRTGELMDLELELVGPVEAIDWWPDGGSLLLLQLVEGRHRLHRYRLDTGRVEQLDTDLGSITAAAVRPDGEVWYRVHHGEHPARILASGSARPLLEADGPAAPLGRDFESWWFTNPDGARVHGFLVRPEGEGPHPVILRVHGGPHSADLDRWAPDLQAHVDAGFLVAMVNYRGSVGYGQAWRDALKENVGFLELEDVLAGLDDLVERGLADPARVVLAGWSWGGYVTLLGIGRHPDRFASAIGGVPVADYVAAYEDESPILQAMDRSLFGGSPSDLPDLYRERNPIEYAAAVRVPLLILAGENDTRCPIRQVWNYVDRLRTGGIEPEVYTYATGHSSFDVEERVRQTAIVLDFLARTVPGVTRLEGLDAHLAAAGVATPA